MKHKKMMRLLGQSFRIAGADKILYAYLILYVIIAAVLYITEPSIHSFGDSVWYCFAVATTIGFGDIAAVSVPGRVLTIILSLYSVAVVAIITAVITGFFMDIAKVKLDESVKEFMDELEHLPELSPEELKSLSERIKRFRS